MNSLLVAAVAAISLATSPAVADSCSTIVDTAVATPELSTLVAAVTAADLVGPLSDPAAALTVLAPTNDAFAAVGTPEELTADVDALTDVLLLHVIDGAVLAADLMDGMVVETLGGMSLTVGVSDAGVTFTAPNGGTTATVAIADITACASVVHVIDTVLLPGEEAPAAAMGEDDMAGMYGSYSGEEAGAYGSYGAADAATEDSAAEEEDGGDVTSANVLILGAVAAGVLSALAGVAVVAVRRRNAAAAPVDASAV